MHGPEPPYCNPMQLPCSANMFINACQHKVYDDPLSVSIPKHSICCFRQSRPRQNCATFVRSKQSMQLVRKIPSWRPKHVPCGKVHTRHLQIGGQGTGKSCRAENGIGDFANCIQHVLICRPCTRKKVKGDINYWHRPFRLL